MPSKKSRSTKKSSKSLKFNSKTVALSLIVVGITAFLYTTFFKANPNEINLVGGAGRGSNSARTNTTNSTKTNSLGTVVGGKGTSPTTNKDDGEKGGKSLTGSGVRSGTVGTGDVVSDGNGGVTVTNPARSANDRDDGNPFEGVTSGSGATSADGSTTTKTQNNPDGTSTTITTKTTDSGKITTVTLKDSKGNVVLVTNVGSETSKTGEKTISMSTSNRKTGENTIVQSKNGEKAVVSQFTLPSNPAFKETCTGKNCPAADQSNTSFNCTGGNCTLKDQKSASSFDKGTSVKCGESKATCQGGFIPIKAGCWAATGGAATGSDGKADSGRACVQCGADGNWQTKDVKGCHEVYAADPSQVVLPPDPGSEYVSGTKQSNSPTSGGAVSQSIYKDNCYDSSGVVSPTGSRSDKGFCYDGRWLATESEFNNEYQKNCDPNTQSYNDVTRKCEPKSSSLTGVTGSAGAVQTGTSNPTANSTNPSTVNTGIDLSILGGNFAVGVQESGRPTLHLGLPGLPTSTLDGVVGGGVVGGTVCAASIVGLAISPLCALGGAVAGGLYGYFNQDTSIPTNGNFNTGFNLSLMGADLGLGTNQNGGVGINLNAPQLPTSPVGGAVNGFTSCAATVIGAALSPICAILGGAIGYFNQGSQPATPTNDGAILNDTGPSSFNTSPLTRTAGQPAANVSQVNNTNFVSFYQKDYGNGIAENGCYLTVGAMIISNYGTVDRGATPDELNDKYLQGKPVKSGYITVFSGNAYDQNNITLRDVSGEARGNVLGYVADHATVDQPITLAIYCDTCYKDGGHFVLVVGENSNGDPMIYDPLKDQSAPVALNATNYPGLNFKSVDVHIVETSNQQPET